MISNDAILSKHAKSLGMLQLQVVPELQASMPEFWQSRQMNECSIAVTGADVGTRSAVLEWLRAKRCLAHADEYLRQKRAEEVAANRCSNVKWIELHAKGHQLHESYIKFQQFVAENADKRKRALKKIAEERKAQLWGLTRLEVARSQHALLLDVRAKLELGTRQFRIYPDYLQAVVESAPGRYRTVNDIIMRYAALMEVREQIGQLRTRYLSELDQANVEYARLVAQSQRTLMQLSSEHVLLLVRYERAHSKALLWEAVVARIRSASRDKQRDLEMVRASVRATYAVMCERHDGDAPCTDFAGQLAAIKDALGELQKVDATIRRMPAAASRASLHADRARHDLRATFTI